MGVMHGKIKTYIFTIIVIALVILIMYSLATTVLDFESIMYEDEVRSSVNISMSEEKLVLHDMGEAEKIRIEEARPVQKSRWEIFFPTEYTKTGNVAELKWEKTYYWNEPPLNTFNVGTGEVYHVYVVNEEETIQIMYARSIEEKTQQHNSENKSQN